MMGLIFVASGVAWSTFVSLADLIKDNVPAPWQIIDDEGALNGRAITTVANTSPIGNVILYYFLLV
jgi:hypothetical protein